MPIGAYSHMKALSADQVRLISGRARALGDPTRLRILDSLARAEQPVGQIAAATATQQSTASKHLQVLFHAGLVNRRREASTVFYSLAGEGLLDCVRFLGRRQLSGSSRINT